jgi:5-methylcytosine-specific restriction endonuclease McrA
MKGSQEKDNDNDNGVDKNEIIVKNNNCNDSNAMTVKKHRHTRNGSTKRRLQLWNSIFSNNTTCFVCDVSISYHDYEAAHVIPLCKGGNNSFENLRICCKSCNKICGTKNLLEFKNEYRKINQNNYEKKEIPKFIAINNCVEKSRNSKSLRTLIFIFVCNLCRKISGFINYLKLLLSYNKKN